MRKSTCFIFAVVLILTCSNAFAQSSVIVMKAMNGTSKLNGNSIIPGHTGEIDVLSDSHGEVLCATCNIPAVSDFNVMIKLSAATIALKKLLFNGTLLTSLTVYYIKQGSTPFTYYKIHMENVKVSSVQESASSEEPVFAISFTPSRIAWAQIKQNPDGSVGTKTVYGWDVDANKFWSFPF